MFKFKWHEEVRLIKGYTRSLIYDLPRVNYQFISNDIYETIHEFEGKKKGDIEQEMNKKKEWFDVFWENEYYFYSPSSVFGNFSKIPLTWSSPSRITNLIIDLPDEGKITTLIDCDHLVLRFPLNRTLKVNEIEKILDENLKSSTIRSVDIYVNIDKINHVELIKEMCEKHAFINNFSKYMTKNQKHL